MRALILVAIMAITACTTAQNNITSNIIEGGKTIVELVRVFKTPKTAMVQQSTTEKKDSCAVKAVSDVCIKNLSANPVIVSLYRRNGSVYETTALSVKVLSKNQEFLYEVRAGIYKMKIETDAAEGKKLFKEGEMKINACENVYKEIKTD